MFYTIQRHYIIKFYRRINKNSQKYILLRPLIQFSRFECLKFCEFWSLPVYPDLTNLNLKMERNRLRLQSFPYLKFFFNLHLFNKIDQIQKIINFENQYFKLIIKKFFFSVLTDLKKKKNKIFSYERLTQCFIKSKKSVFFVDQQKKEFFTIPKNKKKKKKKSKQKRTIIFFFTTWNIPRRNSIYSQFYKKFNLYSFVRKFSKNLSCFNDCWFFTRPSVYNKNSSSQSYFFRQLFLKKKNFFRFNSKNSKIFYFPKILQYRFIHNFFYSLKKKISFNEISCFLKKI